MLCSLWNSTFQKGKDRLSTIHFQGRAVKLWGCISTKCILAFFQPVNSGNNDYVGIISPYKNHQKPYVLGIFVIYWCDAAKINKNSISKLCQKFRNDSFETSLDELVSAPYPFLVGTKNSIHKSGKPYICIYIYTDVYQMIPYVSSTFKTHIFQAKLASPGKGV